VVGEANLTPAWRRSRRTALVVESVEGKGVGKFLSDEWVGPLPFL
jgi:hypothetical protein